MTAIAVTSLGMITSLGSTVQACAAARAGLSRAGELDVASFAHDVLYGEEDGEDLPAVIGHATRGVADGFAGLGKAMALSSKAFGEALEGRKLSPREIGRTALFVNLKDAAIEDHDHRAAVLASDPDDELRTRETPSAKWKRVTESLADRLVAALALEAAPAATLVRHGGQAGVAALVEEATARIARGTIDRAWIGGVDSRVEPRFLAAAARLGLLRTNRNPVGFAPGEAACFFLLERAEDAARAGVRALAEIASAVTADDERSYLGELRPDGRGLASVVARAVKSTSPGLVVSDHDGLERRAFDWGNAITKLRAEAPIDGLATWYPAVNFGSTGAAAGALGVCVVVRAFERGYAPAGGAVVALASDTSQRGAIGLRRAG